MGWARMLLLGDIGNRLDIDDVEQDVASVKEHLQNQHQIDSTQDAAIHRLQQENDELKVCLTGLMRLLLSKKVLTPEELNQFVNMVDPKESP